MATTKGSQWRWSLKDDGNEVLVFLEVYDGAGEQKIFDTAFDADQAESAGTKFCEMAAKLRRIT